MTKKRANSAVRQRQILDAARRLVVKYGSEHVTVRRIAQEVGVTEGAIYRHFKSKRDVLRMFINSNCHCEEQSDEAIPKEIATLRSQ